MPVFLNRSGGRYRPGGAAPVITQRPTAGLDQIRVHGLRTIQKRLDLLEKDFQVKISNFALWKASEPMWQLAINKAPWGETGNLKKSILRKRVKRNKVVVNVDIGAAPKIAPYAHIVELGAVAHSLNGNRSMVRKTLGRMPRVRGDLRKGVFYPSDIPAYEPQPFLRPAFEEEHTHSVNIYAEEAFKKLSRYLKEKESVQLG